jgi:hypothetical protein
MAKWLKEGRSWQVSLCLDNVVRVRESTFKLTGPGETTASPVGREREFADVRSALLALLDALPPAAAEGKQP